MELRQAILRAADDISRDGSLYDFMKGCVGECGTPCCALARIGLHAGAKEGRWWNAVCRDLFHIDTCEWYCRVARPVGYEVFADMPPAKVAEGLRLYADKYHPAPIVLPDWNALASEPLPVAERVAQV